jgi:hypothetical protein
MAGQRCAGITDVLAVVEDHERFPGRHVSRQGVEERLAGDLADTHRARDCRHGEVGVGERRQRGEPDAVGEAVDDFGAELDGEARLAAPACTDERDQAPIGEEQAGLSHLADASDEGRELDGEVVRHPVQRPQRWEIEGQARPAELGDAFRPAEVTEVVDAEVPEEPAVRQLISHEHGGGRRHQDLPRMGQGPQSGAAVERLAHVASLVAQSGVASMYRHAQLHVEAARPRFLVEGPRQRGGEIDGVARLGEAGHEVVPLALLHRARAA